MSVSRTKQLDDSVVKPTLSGNPTAAALVSPDTAPIRYIGVSRRTETRAAANKGGRNIANIAPFGQINNSKPWSVYSSGAIRRFYNIFYGELAQLGEH